MSAVQPVKPVSEVPKAGKPAAASKPTAAEIAKQVRHERARRLLRNLLLWVGLPTLMAVVYYGALANPEYESQATLIVRGHEGDAAFLATTFREYVLSQDALSALEGQVAFSKHFAQAGDPLSGLAANAGSETRYAFFRKHVDARYDSHSRVLTLQVRAFSGKQAQTFAKALMDEGTRFVSSVQPESSAPFVVVQKPSAPTESKYPKRIYGILTVLVTSLSLFAIVSLLVAAVREHAQF